MIDLGKWARGDYIISTPLIEGEDEEALTQDIPEGPFSKQMNG